MQLGLMDPYYIHTQLGATLYQVNFQNLFRVKTFASYLASIKLHELEELHTDVEIGFRGSYFDRSVNTEYDVNWEPTKFKETKHY